MANKPLNFWQLWNMSFGFFGIQFGWGLQMANTSAIFEHLGANAHEIPILWLAAPLTGLLVQPIIGNLSDNTWGKLGRRRPYFLVGAIFASIALVLMPNASSLWMAAGLLWLLDTSANISMEPFRAFVGDLLPPHQRTRGYAMQSLFIGLGAVVAAAMPWVLNHWFHIDAAGIEYIVPPTVKWSFYIGAAAFLITVLWTIVTTQEDPPKDMQAFQQQQKEQLGIIATGREILTALRDMPPTMRQLAWVQCFSWLGMYCMFLYFPPAVARNILGAVFESSQIYAEGIEWAGICIAMYNAVCFAFSFVLPRLVQVTNRKIAHTICLGCGGIGLLSLLFIHNRYMLLLSMVGVGIAWAGLLAMPYAILIGALPPKRSGVYLGIFNFFIVVPEILASLGLSWVMAHWLNNDRLFAVAMGGVFMLIAALFVHRVEDVSLDRRIGEFSVINNKHSGFVASDTEVFDSESLLSKDSSAVSSSEAVLPEPD
jgi:maltose/moltooligosaccharide transporter